MEKPEIKRRFQAFFNFIFPVLFRDRIIDLSGAFFLIKTEPYVGGYAIGLIRSVFLGA